MRDTCPQCGSKKIVPDLQLIVNVNISGGGRGIGTADVMIAGAPQAWIFKDAVTGGLMAKICGECGHAELHVKNFSLLHEKYEKAQQS